MKIKINYFGQLRIAAGLDSEEIGAADDETVSGLIASLAARHGPGFGALVLEENGRGLRPSLIVLLDRRTVDKNAKTALSGSSEVSLITAIAGG